MAKRLTKDSLETKEDTKTFNLTLDSTVNNQLVNYIILTQEGKHRNEFINDLIKEALSDKVLTNDYINLSESDYFYFNKNELLENGKVNASTELIRSDVKNIMVVKAVPNNLDTFNKELETYCINNNQHHHAGAYILPATEDTPERYFSFDYNSGNRELTIRLLDDKDDLYDVLMNHELFKKMTAESKEIKFDLLTQLRPPLSIPFVMFSYKLNEILKGMVKRGERENLDDFDEIFFDGIFF